MIVDNMVVVGAGGIRRKRDLTLRTNYAGIAAKELSLSRIKIEEKEPWKDALIGWFSIYCFQLTSDQTSGYENLKTSLSSSSSSSSGRSSPDSRSDRSSSTSDSRDHQRRRRSSSSRSGDSRSDEPSDLSNSNSPTPIISLENDQNFLEIMVGYNHNQRTFIRTFNERRGRTRRQRNSRRFHIIFEEQMTVVNLYFLKYKVFLGRDTLNQQVNQYHQSQAVSAADDLAETEVDALILTLV